MSTETVEIRPEADPREQAPVSDVALWAAVLLGPVSFLANLQITYVMVDWACASGTTWALHLSHAIAVAVAVVGVLVSRSFWQRAGGTWPDGAGGSAARTRLISVIGTLGGALFALSIGAQWLTVAILGACLRA